jgi:hypothetical protein
MADIKTKLEYWKNRLLDLGKRNRLINCPLLSDASRVQRHSLLISIPTATELWTLFEDTGAVLSFSVPLQLSLDGDDDEQLSMSHSGIKTNQTTNETYKTLRSLMKKAKEFSEEKGLNALHLAFGFLDWKESGDKGQDMRSPLLLVPVTLTQDDLFSPIILTRDDEEISPNHSLIQKLNSDFGIEFPAFTDGSDLDDYLSDVRNAVKSLGWSVSNDVVQLSLFSFMKINMYRDLERNGEKISTHHIIRALNGETFRDSADVSDVAGYNHDANEPQEVFSVVDADSSQQDAILLAKRGASFVLQGPPGTGKSQTITNIIAELIANGKKVLFVSEKMAALEVVYKRLSQTGLGDFCLTLHSHNAKRREVLDQFEKSIKMSRTRANLQQDAFNKLYNLKDARGKLNQYNTELHTIVEPLGKTIFQVYGYLAQLEDYPNIDYVQSGADAFTQTRLSQCENALVEVTRIISESGYQQNNPWNGCVLTTPPTFEFKQRFVVDADALLNQLNTGISLFSEANTILGAQIEWKYSEVAALRAIYGVAKKSPAVLSSWISLDIAHILQLVGTCCTAVSLGDQLSTIKETLDEAEKDCEKQAQKYSVALQTWQTAHNELISENNDGVLTVDAQTMLGLYRESYRSWLRGFIAGYRKSQRFLSSYRKSISKLSYEDGLILLDKIVTVKSLKTESDQQENALITVQKHLDDCRLKLTLLEKEYASLFFENVCQELSNALNAEINGLFDFEKLKSELLWCSEFQKYAAQNSLGAEFIEAVCAKDDSVFDRIDKNIYEVKSWFSSISLTIDKFIKVFSTECENSIKSLPFDKLVGLINTLKNGFASLEYLIDYRNAEQQLATLGIDSYLLKAKELNLRAEEIIPVFKKCFFLSWLDAVMPDFSAINEFRRLRQDERVAAFKDLDKTHLEISRAMLIARLISHLPNFDAFAQNGELALLRRELAKQRKLMPIRKLIAALPNLLPKLKPCMLMSPLSVSTYLGDSNYEFDAVIFDEASQVRTEDAIGAIFRAKQAIIAGDSKQLPPTDFFTSSMSASDDFEEDEDGEIDDTGAYESLLDEALYCLCRPCYGTTAVATSI